MIIMGCVLCRGENFKVSGRLEFWLIYLRGPVDVVTRHRHHYRVQDLGLRVTHPHHHQHHHHLHHHRHYHLFFAFSRAPSRHGLVLRPGQDTSIVSYEVLELLVGSR